MDYQNNGQNQAPNQNGYQQAQNGYQQQQNGYQQPQGFQGYQPVQPMKPVIPGHGFAIASLVLGIVSFFCFAIITGILAIVFGAIAKNKGNTEGKATAGIVCGVIGVALYIFMLVFMSELVGSLLPF